MAADGRPAVDRLSLAASVPERTSVLPLLRRRRTFIILPSELKNTFAAPFFIWIQCLMGLTFFDDCTMPRFSKITGCLVVEEYILPTAATVERCSRIQQWRYTNFLPSCRSIHSIPQFNQFKFVARYGIPSWFAQIAFLFKTGLKLTLLKHCRLSSEANQTWCTDDENVNE